MKYYTAVYVYTTKLNEKVFDNKNKRYVYIVRYIGFNKYIVSHQGFIHYEIDEQDLEYPEKEPPIKTLAITHKFKENEHVFDKVHSIYGTIISLLPESGMYLVDYGTFKNNTHEKNLDHSDFGFATW